MVDGETVHGPGAPVMAAEDEGTVGEEGCGGGEEGIGDGAAVECWSCCTEAVAGELQEVRVKGGERR